MQAITVRYIGPTDHRWIRYKASCPAGTITLVQDDNLDPEQNYIRAARALITKLEWFHDETRGDTYGRWFFGVTGNGVYTFVCAVDSVEVRAMPSVKETV